MSATKFKSANSEQTSTKMGCWLLYSDTCGIFPVIDIFSYLGYADSTDTVLHSCFDLLFAEAACLSLRYPLYPVSKEQMKPRSQKVDILSLEIFQDIASSSPLRVH